MKPKIEKADPISEYDPKVKNIDLQKTKINDFFIELNILADCAAIQTPIPIRTIDGGCVKIDWTNEKCVELLTHIDITGLNDLDPWKRIATLMNVDHLPLSSHALSIKYNLLRPWTQNDDDQLVSLFEKHMFNWILIASKMDIPRSPFACRSRWKILKN